jgi:hypothetical protein
VIRPLSGQPHTRIPRQDHIDMTTGEDLPLPPPPMSLMTGGSLSRFAQVREFPAQSLGNLRSLSSAGLPLASAGSMSSPTPDSPEYFMAQVTERVVVSCCCFAQSCGHLLIY